MIMWRDVPGWEGFYQVSNAGDVRSVDRAVFALDNRGNPCVRHYVGRALKPGTMPNGYKMVAFTRPGGGRSCLCIHYLVCLAFHGPRPAGLEVRHLDGTRDNNQLSNLCYGTCAENAADKKRHGRAVAPQGEQCGAAKLTDDAVRSIRALAVGRTHRDLGARFGVSHNRIGEILRGQAWRHVQ